LSAGWTGYAPPVPSITTWSHAPSYALQAGWVVAGALLLLALPWSDRRGRPPVRASRVAALALGAIVDIDLVLAAMFSDVTHGESAGILGWLMAVGAMVLLIVAAWREWHTHRAGGPYLSVALLLAAAYQVALLANFPAGYPSYQWADALTPLIPVIVFAGLLMEQRGEASRMRRATDRAQEVMGGRAEIASMIAHEVRGPVSTVRGIASTSLTHFDRLSDDERREFLEMIEQESGRLMETVDQMSLALKVDAGTLTYQPRPLALSEVVRAGVIVADVSDHPVEIDVKDELSVVADDRRLQEVVRQLVSNAARYSPEGAPSSMSSTPVRASRPNCGSACSRSSPIGARRAIRINLEPASASSSAGGSSPNMVEISTWLRGRAGVRCSAFGYRWRGDRGGRRSATGHVADLRRPQGAHRRPRHRRGARRDARVGRAARARRRDRR